MERPFPSYRGDAPYVFVCYAHQDAAVVYPELVWLRDQGINVWYDEGISPGEEWTEELGRAIEGAERFVYFVTPASVASRNCRDEVHFAKSHGTPILAVHVEPTVLPTGLELAIGASQAILNANLTPAGARAKLLDALRRTAQGKVARNHRAASGSAPVVRRWMALAAGLTVLVAIAVGVVWWMSTPAPTQSTTPIFSRSVAVATFGADAANASYATALRDELHGLLASYPELETVDATAETGAAYRVGGSVQGEGDRLRVRAQLSRVSDGRVVWSDAFGVDDPATGPAPLATRLARLVRLELMKDEQCEAVKRRTDVLEAAEAVCAAQAVNYQINQGGSFDPELQRLHAQRAVALDPGLAQGHAWLGDAYANLREHTKARTALDEALRLDPHDPIAWLLSATRRVNRDLDYRTGAEEARHGLELDPRHPNARWLHALLGDIAVRQGDVTGALSHYARAVRIYDADARIYAEYGGVLLFAGQFREALAVADAGLALVDDGVIFAVLNLQKVAGLLLAGERERAERALADAMAALRPELQPAMSISYALMGRVDEARRLLQSLPPDESAIKPRAYAALSDRDGAFVWLHRAIDNRDGFVLRSLRADPFYDSLREDPRWDEVMTHLEREEAAAKTRDAQP